MMRQLTFEETIQYGKSGYDLNEIILDASSKLETADRDKASLLEELDATEEELASLVSTYQMVKSLV